MNITGVLVHARPDKAARIAQRLAAMPGVEVHQRNSDGRMVVTVEDVGGTTAGERLLEIQRLEGLLSAALVYHHFESDSDETASAPAPTGSEGDGPQTEESQDAAVTA